MLEFFRTLSGWNRVLLALAVLQLGVVIADRVFVKEAYAPDRVITTSHVFPALDPSAVTKLHLTGGGRTTELERRGDRWVVANEDGVPADEYFIKAALDSLVRLAPGTVVAENPDRHQAYDVAGDRAMQVTVFGPGDSNLGQFVCGRTMPDGRGFYLRYPSTSDLVMLTAPNLREAFVRSGNIRGAWREKTIFKDDPRRIRGFTLTGRNGAKIEIERVVDEGAVPSDQDEWRMTAPEPGPVLSRAAHAMAAGMSELRADGYGARGMSDGEMGLAPPKVRVSARLDDGTDRVLEIGDEVSKQLYVRVPGEDEVFRVHVYRLFNFTKTAAELRGR